MRGSNIKNIYIIDSKEFQFKELNKDQVKYVESISNKTKYNELKSLIDKIKKLLEKIKYYTN